MSALGNKVIHKKNLTTKFVRVVSVRIGIEKSECKVFLPCEQVLV
jgi:hypothetical protein